MYFIGDEVDICSLVYQLLYRTMAYFFQNLLALYRRETFRKSYFGHKACWYKSIAIAHDRFALDFNSLCADLQGLAGFSRVNSRASRECGISSLQRVGQASVQAIADAVSFEVDPDLIAVV